ncbi:oxidoreductase FAD-binding protein [Rutstroemia sp. NJR-2017a WRK4]|nr:oxidoreductase FAD-binding protein [Rutstroemia sp. NJR-2017a WRK4]PQE11838.1 oxidoreductase FAD-binding protein [Rutstroemia sp. NJR-2017a WRK4]
MTSSTYNFLSKELEGKIAQPHSNAYEASLKSYFTLQETELRPAFIISPTSADDVSCILKNLAACDAETGSRTKVAVRGGGHSPFAGSANVNDGITIDLRSINTVEVNETRGIASIGGGAIWGHVYEKLDPLGLSVVGGHVYDVGIGGFTLGGGFSSLSPRYGMCCDMVENFEVVLASGEIINANANENPDLWTALKGGSNNFGIVTRFDMRTFQQGKQWAGLVVYPVATLDQHWKAFESMGNDWDPYGSLKLSITFSPQTKFAIAVNFEYTKEDSAPDVFRAFMDITPQYRNTMKITTLSETAKDIQKLQTNGVRQIFATTSFYYSAVHLQNVYSLFNDAVASVENIKGVRWTLTYWRIHSSVTSKSAANGGNSTGLDTSGGSLVLCVLTYSWEDASDDEAMNGAAKLFIEEVDRLSSDAGLFNRYKYVNYSAGYQDPISGYGDEMKAKLQAISKKYDPEGFFQMNVPGGFKIF